jgi:hypothetical protein
LCARFAKVLNGNHSSLARVAIVEEIIQNPREPCLHVGSRRVLAARPERPRAGLLNAILRIVRVFHEIVSHAVEMIEIGHDLRRKLIRIRRAYFASRHGAVILTKTAPYAIPAAT